MRKVLSAALLTSLLVLFSGHCCFSQENFSRYGRSAYTEKYLTEKKIECQKNTIVPEYLGEFPYNITVEIPAQVKKEIIYHEESIDQVIFAFTQDFFIKDPEFIVSFIENTKENKLPYNCTVLLTGDDEKTVLETQEEVPCASDYYAERLYETSSVCAFVITDEDYFPAEIKTTGAGHISPMWIVKSVQNAFQANQKFIIVQQSILYHNRSHLFKNSGRLSAFNRNEIISTSFPLGHGSTDLSILNTLQNEIITSRKQGGNTLYNVLIARKFSIWINESLLVLIYLTFAGFALFTVWFSSFAYNARNEAIFKDLSRTWFFAPTYILLSTLFLCLFQLIFSATQNSPVLYFALKITFALSTLFIISAIQNYYRFRISLASISFQQLILCALNIFIFAFIDLSLMFVFIIEYLIVLMARKSNRKTVAVVVLLLMMIPFLQPATSVYLNIRHDRLSEMFRTSFARNLIFSLILVPFTFQWIRCILIFNLYENSASGKKATSVISGIIISSICSVALISIFLAGGRFITRFYTTENGQHAIKVKESSGNEVNFDYSTTSNFDLVTHKLDISTGAERKILRCLVTLKADSNPLYECNFNYLMKSPTEAAIEIPDGPEGNISLSFSSDYGVPIHARMEFYILTDGENAIHEIREMELTGKMDDEKAI